MDMSEHEEFMRRAFELAILSGKKGNATFGAVLVHNGTIIATAENTSGSGKGYGHAEYNLAMKSALEVPEDTLRESVFYASSAPCNRCAFSILALGVKRIVIGVSDERFWDLVPSDHDNIPIREIVRRLGLSDVEVAGPVLEEEGLKVFEHWGGEYKPLEQIIETARNWRNWRDQNKV